MSVQQLLQDEIPFPMDQLSGGMAVIEVAN